ncbi:unnamed protein product [Rotaria sp. Silwood2]|nr:unnamed protein product [Rotaria sp. Silwood2]
MGFILFDFFLIRRYGFKIEREYVDASVLYVIQVILTILLACEPILLYATESTAFGKTKVTSCFVFVVDLK